MIFIDVFKLLKQRIVWKFEDENLENVPTNVIIRKWIPQKDILAHPNVVLLISHGGPFNNFEALARGVPTLMIPFSENQHQNALHAQDVGYGAYFDFDEMTEASLFHNIREMIDSKSYFEYAKTISAIYEENSVQSIDQDILWIEHVCRHNRAKSQTNSKPSHSFLDIFLLVTICTIVVVFCVYLVLTQSWSERNRIRRLKKKQRIIAFNRKKLDVIDE